MPQQITECCECSPAWHLLEFVMTLETEAEGAAESSCGDECQRPLPDQVSGYATILLRAAGLLP